MKRVSVLGLGGMSGGAPVAGPVAVLAVGEIVGTKIKWSITLPEMSDGKGATGFVLSDATGRVRLFADLGAALRRVKRALDPVGGVLSVSVTFEGEKAATISADFTAEANRRALVLSKLSSALNTTVGGYTAAIASMTGWGALGGVYQMRYDEISARIDAVSIDLVEVNAQLAALPVVSLKPDS